MEQLLTTKLFIPSTRPELVRRPRLIQQLNKGLNRKLTLISAPAGFGKTTLISEWVDNLRVDSKIEHQTDNKIAWLSLDENDNEPARFFTYFITALNQIEEIDPTLWKSALDMLQSPQSPPIDTILTNLINKLATISIRIIFVLDDYHLSDAQSVHDALSFMLENLPPQLHLVITTREDPHLPLARLRAKNQLTELRVADLRFTPDEASAFLNQMMGLSLSAEEITTLENRTEGWIAGLQLAALSMQGQEDIHGFIKAFAGDNRYIVDYLVDEVLRRQPEHIRSFLLKTAILDRLNGPLCDTVTGQKRSKALLESLERSNLFVVPLDDKRHWYRYHHLFADVLYVHAMDDQPDLMPTLHRRASGWYEHNGSLAKAVHHALAAKDFELIASLVEMAWPAMDSSRQHTIWLGWVRVLPEEMILTRPMLSVGYAWALLDSGELEAAEARLRDAEWALEKVMKTSNEGTPSDEIVIVDHDDFQFLPATIAAARTYHSLALGDLLGTMNYAQQALDILPEKEYLRRGTPASLMGLASWASGDLEAADRSFTDAITSFEMAGNILFAITGAYVLALIKTEQGHLRQALKTYQQSLHLAEGQGEYVLWGTADLHTGLSELLHEQGRLEDAKKHLLRSKELGDQVALPRWYFRWCVAQALIKQEEGDLESALELLDEAERRFVRGPVPDVRPIAALKTRFWITQGRLSEALGWARQQGLSVDDDLSYFREFDYITLARMHIALYKIEPKKRSILDAVGLLKRLLEVAEEGGRTGSVIEILLLQALAHEAQADISAALIPLERALKLAEPEGYVRVFIDEGIPMAHLFHEATARGIMPNYVGKLLAKFETGGQENKDKSFLSSAQSLIEPLSQRELEILLLITQGLSNREISERIFLALSTVKGHNTIIYGKLQAKSRTEAVARAREFGLV